MQLQSDGIAHRRRRSRSDTHARDPVHAACTRRSGTTRQLDPARASLQTGLARSSDGSALYFIAEDLSGTLPRYSLREALAGREAPVGEVLNGPLAVSADGHRVLYRNADGASVLDASGAIFAVPPTCPVRSGARVRGDLETASLVVEKGAFFQGATRMDPGAAVRAKSAA